MMRKGIVAALTACLALLATLLILFTVVFPVSNDQAQPKPITFTTESRPKPMESSPSPSENGTSLDEDGFRVYPRGMRYEQFKPPTVLPPAFTKWVRSSGFDENDSIPVLETVGDLKVAERGPAKTDPTFGVTVAYRDSQERKVWLMIRADSHPWDVEIADLREVRTVGPALCGRLPPPDTLDCLAMTAEADVHLSFGSESSDDIYSDEEIIALFNTVLEAYNKLQ